MNTYQEILSLKGERCFSFQIRQPVATTEIADLQLNRFLSFIPGYCVKLVPWGWEASKGTAYAMVKREKTM